jgi:hypothetical protein
MAKGGLPDIQLEGMPHDAKTLALFLVEEAARRFWDAGEFLPARIEGFGEVFEVEAMPPKLGQPTHRGWLSELAAGRVKPVERAV